MWSFVIVATSILVLQASAAPGPSIDFGKHQKCAIFYTTGLTSCIPKDGTVDPNNKDAACKATNDMIICVKKLVTDAPNKEADCKDDTVKKNMEASIKTMEDESKKQVNKQKSKI